MGTILRGIVLAFVRLAGEEAVKAYKAKKAKEAREKKIRDSRTTAAMARAEALRIRKEREAKLAAHIAEMDKSAQELQVARQKVHAAEMRREAIENPIAPNPYEE